MMEAAPCGCYIGPWFGVMPPPRCPMHSTVCGGIPRSITYTGTTTVPFARPELSDADVERIAQRVAEVMSSNVAGIRAMHDQVDLTDPNCPVGIALSRAGLAGRP